MSYPTGCFRQAGGLRVRPVPELETCIVFTSRRPKLYMLNLAAWLVFELCDGRGGEQIAADYAAAAGADRDASAIRAEIGTAIERLLGDGLIEHIAA